MISMNESFWLEKVKWHDTVSVTGLPEQREQTNCRPKSRRTSKFAFASSAGYCHSVWYRCKQQLGGRWSSTEPHSQGGKWIRATYWQWTKKPFFSLTSHLFSFSAPCTETRVDCWDGNRSIPPQQLTWWGMGWMATCYKPHLAHGPAICCPVLG